MFNSIRWRIGLSYLVLIVISMALLSAYLLYYVRDYYVSSLEPQLVAQARLVATLSEKQLSTGANDTDALVKLLAQETNSRITVIDRDGEVLGDSHENPAVMENHGQRPEVIQALSSGIGESSRHSATIQQDMLYVAVPFHLNGQIAGVARVALPLQQINEAEGKAARTVVLAILVAGALAIVLALLLSGVAMRPIKELTQMARSLAAGRLDHKIRVRSDDEVGELAEAFNQMSERLNETIKTVSNERNRVAAILSSMADGIIIVDRMGNITRLNEASKRILRLPRRDHIGRSFVEVVRDHELAQLVKESLVGEGPAEGMIETGVPKRFLRAVVTPIREGDTTQSLVVLQDLTELKRSETMRREFVANVSHEIRTPLASIKALVETLQDGALEDPSVATDFLTRMDTEVDGLTQLVGELLELSRIESGQVALKPESTDVLWLVQTAVERLRAQAERSGVELLTGVPSGLPEVMADGERVQQVLINLIHNAIKFTSPGGKISVNAAAEEARVCVSISDTGVGIPADDLPRIFERFYKADKSRSSRGTGLGLAIAKHVVQVHGGDIWVESVEGKGATFTFSLPLACA